MRGSVPVVAPSGNCTHQESGITCVGQCAKAYPDLLNFSACGAGCGIRCEAVVRAARGRSPLPPPAAAAAATTTTVRCLPPLPHRVAIGVRVVEGGGACCPTRLCRSAGVLLGPADLRGAVLAVGAIVDGRV